MLCKDHGTIGNYSIEPTKYKSHHDSVVIVNWNSFPDRKSKMGWTLNETLEFYKSYAKNYDNEVSKETYPAPFIIGDWVVDYLSKSSAIQTRSVRILDVGCGTGQS